jgi:hypothetical protein
MFSKSFRANDIWLWVLFFFVLLLGVNYLLFFAYQHTVPGEVIWVQISNYCGTDTFKDVTISLLIPLILAAMGGIFKIGSTVEERIRSAQAARSKERLSCIEQTSNMWNKIYNLSTEVRYFKKGADDETRIVDILKRLDNLGNEAESVVNNWHFVFNKLESDVTDLFVDSFNFLLDPSTTVAHYIRFSSDKDEVMELQYSLGVIQDEVKAISHYAILNVIRMYADLSDNDLSKKEVNEHQIEISKRLASLKKKNDSIAQEIQQYNLILPELQGREIDIFRASAQKLEEWMVVNGKKYFEEFPGWGNLKEAFNKIPQVDIVNNWEVHLSKETVKHLAMYLGLIGIAYDIKDNMPEPDKPKRDQGFFHFFRA